MADWFNVEEFNNATATSGGGDFKKLPAGGYVVAIQAVRTSGTDNYGREIDYLADKQYIKLIYDISEGEFAGRYSDDYWSGEDKDYGHQIYLSWKNMGAFKGGVQAIEESNPGFDFMAAFLAKNWSLLIGKKVGIVLGEEEYIGNDGTMKIRFTFPRLKSAQDIRDGKFRVPKLKTLDRGSSTPADSSGQDAQTAADPYDDIPFSV